MTWLKGAKDPFSLVAQLNAAEKNLDLAGLLKKVLSSIVSGYNHEQNTGNDFKGLPSIPRHICVGVLLKPHLHGRLFCVRFFDKNGSGKVAFTQRRL